MGKESNPDSDDAVFQAEVALVNSQVALNNSGSTLLWGSIVFVVILLFVFIPTITGFYGKIVKDTNIYRVVTIQNAVNAGVALTGAAALILKAAADDPTHKPLTYYNTAANVAPYLPLSNEEIAALKDLQAKRRALYAERVAYLENWNADVQRQALEATKKYIKDMFDVYGINVGHQSQTGVTPFQKETVGRLGGIIMFHANPIIKWIREQPGTAAWAGSSSVGYVEKIQNALKSGTVPAEFVVGQYGPWANTTTRYVVIHTIRVPWQPPPNYITGEKAKETVILAGMVFGDGTIWFMQRDAATTAPPAELDELFVAGRPSESVGWLFATNTTSYQPDVRRSSLLPEKGCSPVNGFGLTSAVVTDQLGVQFCTANEVTTSGTAWKLMPPLPPIDPQLTTLRVVSQDMLGEVISWTVFDYGSQPPFKQLGTLSRNPQSGIIS